MDIFLRKTERRKNGKALIYWNGVDSARLNRGRVIQHHAIYLGEGSSS